MATRVVSIYDGYLSKVVEIPYNEKVSVNIGERVIFKDDEARDEFGIVKGIDRPSIDEESILNKSRILRPATPNDVQKFENYGDQSKGALKTCQDLVKKHSLDMQVFKANYSFDGSRLLFMFTAEERIDFRDLVRDLAKAMQKQIYLRQIGPRDKAKLVGGYGKCGRSLCCNTFLTKLESISMEMVRIQALESKGSSKLSGVCSKLLCCLRYEVDAYKSLRKDLPNMGDIVKVKRGVVASSRDGKVIALDVLNKKVKLYFDDKEEYLIVESKDIEKVVKAAETPRRDEDKKE